AAEIGRRLVSSMGVTHSFQCHGFCVMANPAPPPRTAVTDSAARPEQVITASSSEQPVAPPTATSVSAYPLAYEDFAAALRSALRDYHRPDLLAQNPLIGLAAERRGAPAGAAELRELLSTTVTTLFANPRDEKLRRVIELTYFQPAPKQEAVADRLSLAF